MWWWSIAIVGGVIAAGLLYAGLVLFLMWKNRSNGGM